MSSKPLVIFGLGDIADVAFTYFSDDSDFDVVAYTVDATYRHRTTFHGLPVVPYDALGDHYEPAEVAMFVAAGYGDNNRTRERLIARARRDGWSLARYVASRAGVWDATVGENCMVIDGTVLQPGARVGTGTILWSNSVVGARATVGACCYIGPVAVIGADVALDDRCVVGPLAHVASRLRVGDTCFIGASAHVQDDLAPGSLLLEPGTKILPYRTGALPPLLRARLYQGDVGTGGGRDR